MCTKLKEVHSMSFGIDTLIYVGERPWTNLGKHYDIAPKSSEEIVNGADMNWTVAAAPMYTELHGNVKGYHAIYREDNNDILGVVNNARPNLVQNFETFEAMDTLINKEVDVETAASLGHGEIIFGCFKIRKQYKVFDDDIDHYFVVMNEHCKVDGKITVLNTPIRVVCQNTLSAALTNNFYKLRIPITADKVANQTLAEKIMQSGEDAIWRLQKRADKMFKQKINRDNVEKLLDELFPYVKVEGDSLYNKQNETTSMIRETFLKDCMGADNLANYRGTNWQILNALVDFDQHYYKKVDKAYDLNYRMSKLPGIGTPTETSKVVKFLAMADELAA